MADRTRPIVRLEVMNRMVTKGYQKGVYERVTKGTARKTLAVCNFFRILREAPLVSEGRE